MSFTQQAKQMPQAAKRAMSLWKSSKSKVTVLTQYNRYMRGEKQVLARYSIERAENGKPKGVIATVHDEMTQTWLYYPRQQDFPVFANASKIVQSGGPAKSFPGAVGSVKVMDTPGLISIVWAQAHFKTGAEAGFVPRKLATEYGGWSTRLLRKIIQKAKQEKKAVGFVIQKKNAAVNKIFVQIIQEEGYKVDLLSSNQETHIIAHPK